MMTISLNKLSLKFDVASMYNDLLKKLVFECNKIIDELENELNKLDFSYATGTFRQEIISYTEKEIIKRVGSEHWYSFIINYGSGSKMVDENVNPFLKKYKESGFYNPIRSKYNSKKIMTRPRGNYSVPDWIGGYGTVVTKGHGVGGYNLEKKGGNFTAIEPKLYLEDEFKKAKVRLCSAINNVFNTFDYSIYIKGGG